MTTYTVKAGDTLRKIGKRFGVPDDAIALVNRIADPNRIRAGQSLLIPEASTDGMTSTTVPVEAPPDADATGEPPINRSKFALPAKEYIPEVAPKDLIVLHFTAGLNAAGAHGEWLSNPVRVATSYIVETDGKIYETFDPAHWAFHLGIKGTSKHDKRSIGIEISNVGPLKVSPADSEVLNWWPSNWGKKWCRVEETDRYVKSSYRGIQYFASYPDPQVAAVAQLVKWLCERFKIKRTIPPIARRMEFDMSFFASFQGIATHHNFRKDKFDVGPAFDWSRLGI